MKASLINPQNSVKLLDAGLPHSLHANQLLKQRAVSKVQFIQLMDIKEERRDLEARRKPLFFLIGLTISLLLVTTAINWKFYDQAGLVDLGSVEGDFEELLEVPLSEQPPPPPPPKQMTEQFNLVAIEDEIEAPEVEISLDVEMTEGQAVEAVVFDALPVEEVAEEKAEEIFAIVEKWPEPVGGMSSFYQYVAENLRYPSSAMRIGVSGMVFVRFVVEKDGKITDVQVVKGIGSGCDEEAVRVISTAPAWTPGKQRGRSVRVYMTVPIRFILQESD